MKLRCSIKAIGIMMLMLLSANAAKADYMLDYGLGYTDYYYRDCSVKLSSPSSARGVVYVDMDSSRKKGKNPYSQTGPAQTSTLKANFEGSSGYECFLLVYPKPGYVLDGFVEKSDYQANRTSYSYFLKDPKGKIYRSGDKVAFARVDTSNDPKSDPTKEDTYRFSAKETVECYAIFRQATSQTVTVKNPGELKTAVENSAQGIEVDNLIVKGEINATDIEFLKTMIKDHHLVRLDLSAAKIEEIPNWAFSWCSSLYEIKLPKSGLTKIGSFAFSGCRNLKSVTVPSSVTEIAESAFSNCTSKEFNIQ